MSSASLTPALKPGIDRDPLGMEVTTLYAIGLFIVVNVLNAVLIAAAPPQLSDIAAIYWALT